MMSDFWVSFFDVWMLYGVAQPSLIWESARRRVLNGLCVCHSLRIVSRYPAHYVFVLLLNAYDWGLNPIDFFFIIFLEQCCNKTKKSRYPKVFFRTPQGSPWFIEVIKWTLCILCFSTTNHLLIMCWSCEKPVLTEALGTAVTAVRIKFARTEQFQQWFIASAPGEVNTIREKTIKKTRMLAVRNKWTWTSSTNLIYMIVCIILYVDMYVSLRALTFKTSTSEPGPNSCGLKPTGCQVVPMFLPHDVYNHLFHYCARVRVRMVISSVVRWC